MSLSQTSSTEEKTEDLEVYDDEEDGDFSDLGNQVSDTFLAQLRGDWEQPIRHGLVLRPVVLLKGDGVVLAKVDVTEEN